MKAVVITLIGVVVLAGLVGWWVYQSDEGGGQEVLVDDQPSDLVEDIEEEDIRMDSVGSQFIQQAPEGGLPIDEVTSKEEGDSVESKKLEDESELVLAEEVVSITDVGFVPEVVTVAVGTEVTFVNNGQGMHWPVADDYASSELEGFDAGHGLSTGEEYSFVFTQEGKWGYRDNLNTSLTGMIVVE